MPAPLVSSFDGVAWNGRFLAVVGEHGQTDVHDLEARRIAFQKKGWPLFQLHRGAAAGSQSLVHVSSDGKTLHAVSWRGKVERSGSDAQEWTEVLRGPKEGYGTLAIDEASGAIALAVQSFGREMKEPSHLVLSRNGKTHVADLGPYCFVEALAFHRGALHLVRVIEGKRPAVIERWADDLSGATRLGEIPGGEPFVAARVTIFPDGTIGFLGARHRKNPYGVKAGVAGVCDLTGKTRWTADLAPEKNPNPQYAGESFGMLFDHADLGFDAKTGALYVPRHFDQLGFEARLERRKNGALDTMKMPGVKRISIAPDGTRALVVTDDPEATRVISLEDGRVLYHLDPIVEARNAKRASAAPVQAKPAGAVPESFHDELAKRQADTGPDRTKKLLAHLRSRTDEPWRSWARAVEIADARMEKIVADMQAGKKPDARNVGNLHEVAAALQVHYALAEEAGLRAGLTLDGRFELAVRSRIAKPPPSLFTDWASLRDFQKLTLKSDPLSFQRGGFTPAAKALAASPHVKWLASLSFYGTGLSPEAALALAASKTLVRLTALSFTWDGLDGEGVAAIVRSPIAKALSFATLDFVIEHGKGQDAAIAALEAPAFAKTIRHLSLRGNALDAEHAKALASYPWLANVTSLDLGYLEGENTIGDEGAKALAASPYVRSLRTLGLAGCGITDDGAKALLASPNLEACAFDMEMNDLSDAVLSDVVDRGVPG